MFWDCVEYYYLPGGGGVVGSLHTVTKNKYINMLCKKTYFVEFIKVNDKIHI